MLPGHLQSLSVKLWHASKLQELIPALILEGCQDRILPGLNMHMNCQVAALLAQVR
jgi:hypothetical protein